MLQNCICVLGFDSWFKFYFFWLDYSGFRVGSRILFLSCHDYHSFYHGPRTNSIHVAVIVVAAIAIMVAAAVAVIVAITVHVSVLPWMKKSLCDIN